MNRSGMGRDKVKTSVATLPCSVTLEELTKSAKRKSVEKICSSHRGVAEDSPLLGENEPVRMLINYRDSERSLCLNLGGKK
jgi:hypothetical protein